MRDRSVLIPQVTSMKPHRGVTRNVAYLMRIGHGIQIPLLHPDLLSELARRNQCLEVCPTTYLKTGTLEDMLLEGSLF